jgi:hypothetical protein
LAWASFELITLVVLARRFTPRPRCYDETNTETAS